MYLIIRVHRAEECDQREPKTALKFLAKRCRAEGVSVPVVEGMLNKAGYDLGPIVGVAPLLSWPLTAVIYCSQNREGVGRSGSSLYRWPCRPQVEKKL